MLMSFIKYHFNLSEVTALPLDATTFPEIFDKIFSRGKDSVLAEATLAMVGGADVPTFTFRDKRTTTVQTLEPGQYLVEVNNQLAVYDKDVFEAAYTAVTDPDVEGHAELVVDKTEITTPTDTALPLGATITGETGTYLLTIVANNCKITGLGEFNDIRAGKSASWYMPLQQLQALLSNATITIGKVNARVEITLGDTFIPIIITVDKTAKVGSAKVDTATAG